MARRRLQDLLNQLPAGSRRSHLARLLEADDMAFDADTEVDPDPETDAAAAADPFDAATETMVLNVLRDADLSADEKIAQITQIITGEVTADDDDTAADDDTSEADAAVTEGVLRKRLAAAEAQLLEAKAEKDARRLLEAARVDVTDKRVNLLKSVNPATRQDLIEEWSQLPRKNASRPQRSPPVSLLEGGSGQHAKPARGAEAMIAAYR